MHFSAEAARETLSLGLIFRSFSFGVVFLLKTIVLLKENHTFSISQGSLFIENVRKLMRRWTQLIGAARTARVPLDRSGGAPGGHLANLEASLATLLAIVISECFSTPFWVPFWSHFGSILASFGIHFGIIF